MRRLLVVLALGAALGLSAGVPTASAQYPGYPSQSYGTYGPGYGGYAGTAAYPGYAGGYAAAGGYPGYAGGYGSLAGAPGVGGYPYPSSSYAYSGIPYGGFAQYAGPIATGLYNPTGYPTFGAFPYLAQYTNTTNPSLYSSYQPYAFFLGCSSTYSGSSFYVCR